MIEQDLCSMKSVVKKVYKLFSIIFLLYLLLPNFTFPKPPPDSLKSEEPGDIETPLRRAYYTNLSREEVLNHYKENFSKSLFLNIHVPTYRLNYPPEESQTLVRDQTRSTFLEEIVHPFRESIFVNGFKPTLARNLIEIDGVSWKQKITVKLISSNFIYRIIIGTFSVTFLYLILFELTSSLKDVIKRK